MRVLYDCDIFNWQKYGGISRYFAELIKGLDATEGVEAMLDLVHTHNHYIQETSHVRLSPLWEKGNFKGKGRILKTLNGINYLPVKQKLKKQKFDVFHPTYFDTYFLKYLGSKPFVLTIYDMVFELFPEYFPHLKHISAYKAELIKRADKIIAISENTKQDILKFFPEVHPDKIQVIYLGNSLFPTTLTQELNLPERYVLYVGTRKNYKNFPYFFEQIVPLLKEDSDLHLVCAGGGKFTAQEEASMKKEGISSQVLQKDLNDTTLFHFYQRALAFVFPTLYEGFGIPALESFAAGCPAILSKVSSLPEVGGDAAKYHEPDQPGHLGEVMKEVIYSEELRNKMRNLGHEQLAKFSWENTVAEHLTLYREFV